MSITSNINLKTKEDLSFDNTNKRIKLYQQYILDFQRSPKTNTLAKFNKINKIRDQKYIDLPICKNKQNIIFNEKMITMKT